MPARKKILIVEDNEINRAMLCNLLSEQYLTIEAENGKEALEILKQQQNKDISLILLDIIMPVMDGYAFLDEMHKNPEISAIPVIVATQVDSEEDETTALAHGASDFVTKPYRPQIILHRVASIIRLRETAAMINQFKHDRLTGLYSKEYFYQKVREILRRSPQKQYDIIVSDIENFKLINDTFGLAVGDEVLINVAEMYHKIIGDKGVYGRISADMFVSMIEKRDDYSNEMFAKIIAEMATLPDGRSVGVKWGIYGVDDRSLPPEQMCDRATLAVNEIKGQYGKYYAVYDDALRSKLLRQQAIINGMDTALSQEQFEVYFQPKHSALTGKFVGAEALIRWNHPEWGIQSPGEFIPLFESNGFITKMDQFVWEKSCALLRRWDDMGLNINNISVNVSRADIYNANIIEILLGIIQKHGLEPSRLHLELTESAYTELPEQIIETATRLRELGFALEMDDFGSGYSSLNMLSQMPLDILKLDMKFLQGDKAQTGGKDIVQFIVEFAHQMGLSVVAEGVETKEQLEKVKASGCDYVQGYYFAKPMRKEDFEELLKNY